MNDFQEIIKDEICPYCNYKTELVSDKEIYGPYSEYGGMYLTIIFQHTKIEGSVEYFCVHFFILASILFRTFSLFVMILKSTLRELLLSISPLG